MKGEEKTLTDLSRDQLDIMVKGVIAQTGSKGILDLRSKKRPQCGVNRLRNALEDNLAGARVVLKAVAVSVCNLWIEGFPCLESMIADSSESNMASHCVNHLIHLFWRDIEQPQGLVCLNDLVKAAWIHFEVDQTSKQTSPRSGKRDQN